MQKVTQLIFSFITVLLLLLLPSVTYADSTSVYNKSNGQSTTCINGTCTTTGGGSTSTVCINGNCTTSNDGNVDMQSDDGHTQVHIHNNTNSQTSPTSNDQPTSEMVTESPNPTSLTPSPTHTWHHIATASASVHVPSHHFDLFQFIKNFFMKMKFF